MPPKKRTRSSSSDVADDANNQSQHTNKRTNKRANTVNTRPARGVLTRGKQYGASAIRPSNQTIDFLLMYPFVLPLVVLLLNDADVLTSLLVTCKTIKLVIKHYEIKLSIKQSIACRLLDVNRYLPSIVTAIHDVSDTSSLASFPSLVQVELNGNQIQFAHLPRSIKQLTLASRFNRLINPRDLPDGLETLIVTPGKWRGGPFIQPGPLPSSLRTLKVGDCFTQPLVVGWLPASLTVLDLGDMWNHPITPGMIPHGVSCLVFGGSFNQPLGRHVLPSSLTSLTLGGSFTQSLDDIPRSVTHLAVAECRKVPIIPDCVTHLYTSDSFDIPCSVTHLVIRRHWEISPDSIPDSVTHLRLERYNSGILPDVIPSSVISLRLGSSFNRVIKPGILPDSLIDLTFGEEFDRALGPGVLPASLKTLTVPVSHTKRISLGSSDTLIIHADVDEAYDA